MNRRQFFNKSLKWIGLGLFASFIPFKKILGQDNFDDPRNIKFGWLDIEEMHDTGCGDWICYDLDNNK